MEGFFLKIVLLSGFAYFYALFLTRIMGRKLISQMTFFDFIVGVSMGSITSDVVLSPSGPLPSILMLLTFAGLTVIMGLSTIKSIQIRKFINSEPVVLIDRGQIVNKNMKKVRLTINDLMMMLREKNYFNISDIEYAIMETNGKLSALLKADKQPATVADLNHLASYKGLTRDLIMDGTILKENLQNANIQEADLLAKLQGCGVDKVQDVFYAGLDSAGSLYISRKQNNLEVNGQYGID